METWQVISGFETYEVSSLARVRRAHSQKLLRGHVTQRGYTAFILRMGGKPHRKLLHRLVATAFIANPDNLPDVAHNDGNSRNNLPSNLRWSTHRDNQMDMRRHGTMQDGEKSITCKLTKDQVQAIISRIRAGEIQRRLAREYAVSPSQISRISLGKRWACMAEAHQKGTSSSVMAWSA